VSAKKRGNAIVWRVLLRETADATANRPRLNNVIQMLAATHAYYRVKNLQTYVSAGTVFKNQHVDLRSVVFFL